MIKIMHVITSFSNAGGAETMLCRVASGMDRRRFGNEVVSLTAELELAERMQAIGIRVRTLGMRVSVPNPLLVMRLAQWIRESKPQVIHTWMYHANLVGAFATVLANHVPVVWGIRHSALDPRIDKRTILVNRACAFLSQRIPARIVCCSEVSQQIHKKLGYAPEKLEVIPNGFDLDEFKPDPIARVSLRDELGIPADTPLIGIAARFHPHKDHRTFVRAAARLHALVPECHFLLCGADGITWQNAELAGWIETAGIRDCCHLLGGRQDMSRVFAGVDIATLTSLTESFPVVIGEAMACGTLCVVTDVGDSALIVGETGRVVAPGDSEALAEAWRELIGAEPEVRRRLGMAARGRVQQYFALRTVVERYQAVYTQLANGTEHAVSKDLLQC